MTSLVSRQKTTPAPHKTATLKQVLKHTKLQSTPPAKIPCFSWDLCLVLSKQKFEGYFHLHLNTFIKVFTLDGKYAKNPFSHRPENNSKKSIMEQSTHCVCCYELLCVTNSLIPSVTENEIEIIDQKIQRIKLSQQSPPQDVQPQTMPNTMENEQPVQPVHTSMKNDHPLVVVPEVTSLQTQKPSTSKVQPTSTTNEHKQSDVQDVQPIHSMHNRMDEDDEDEPMGEEKNAQEMQPATDGDDEEEAEAENQCTKPLISMEQHIINEASMIEDNLKQIFINQEEIPTLNGQEADEDRWERNSINPNMSDMFNSFYADSGDNKDDIFNTSCDNNSNQTEDTVVLPHYTDTSFLGAFSPIIDAQRSHFLPVTPVKSRSHSNSIIRIQNREMASPKLLPSIPRSVMNSPLKGELNYSSHVSINVTGSFYSSESFRENALNIANDVSKLQINHPETYYTSLSVNFANEYVTHTSSSHFAKSSSHLRNLNEADDDSENDDDDHPKNPTTLPPKNKRGRKKKNDLVVNKTTKRKAKEIIDDEDGDLTEDDFVEGNKKKRGRKQKPKTGVSRQPSSDDNVDTPLIWISKTFSCKCMNCKEKEKGISSHDGIYIALKNDEIYFRLKNVFSGFCWNSCNNLSRDVELRLSKFEDAEFVKIKSHAQAQSLYISLRQFKLALPLFAQCNFEKDKKEKKEPIENPDECKIFFGFVQDCLIPFCELWKQNPNATKAELWDHFNSNDTDLRINANNIFHLSREAVTNINLVDVQTVHPHPVIHMDVKTKNSLYKTGSDYIAKHIR
jgi:hypothetical protein